MSLRRSARIQGNLIPQNPKYIFSNSSGSNSTPSNNQSSAPKLSNPITFENISTVNGSPVSLSISTKSRKRKLPSDASSNLISPVSSNASCSPQPRKLPNVKTENHSSSVVTVPRITPDNAIPPISPHRNLTKLSPINAQAHYRVRLGETPFPNWPRPTPEECEEINRILSDKHGIIKNPKTELHPTLVAAGCSKPPSVLDSLILTRLSAATSDVNSGRAFRQLINIFGPPEKPSQPGNVNWNLVRKSDFKSIFNAIKTGGLANVKTKHIKEILEMVYRENLSRLGIQVHNIDSINTIVDLPKGIDESDMVDLNYIHKMTKEDAFNHLLRYPGIGPKSASCVLLFCLHKPSFTVDTHVFRLCKWLGWVPPNCSTRDSTYAHCDVMVPDHLKYSLHNLFINHGRVCPRCRAATSHKSKNWSKGCVIEHLVNRTGKRKELPESESLVKFSPSPMSP